MRVVNQRVDLLVAKDKENIILSMIPDPNENVE